MIPVRRLLTAPALCVCFVASLALADNPPQFTATWQSAKLVVTGDLSSAGHRALLNELIETAFADADVEQTLSPGATPPGWSLVTEQALRTVALTLEAELKVDLQSVTVTGVRDKDTDWQRTVARLEASLLPGMQLIDNVTVFSDSPSFSELCREQFMAAKKGRRVTFKHSSAVLSPASAPLLDALVEVAADCPSAFIVITGHTDASGEPDYNLSLSTQRALAVRDYLAQRGIAVERLSAIGAGSSQPLTESNTPAARARNRRIEFDWLMPVN